MRAVSETTAAATYGDAIAAMKLKRFNLKLRELIDASCGATIWMRARIASPILLLSEVRCLI